MIHILISLIYTFFFSNANSENFSDYKNYERTKIKLKFKEISKDKLSYPWGMTFIDEKNLFKP